MKILVTGATGYIGSSLVPRLVAAGHEVTGLVRRGALAEGAAFKDVRVVRGDLLDAPTLPHAVNDVEVIYYLVHSMTGGKSGFAERDQIAARNLAIAAKQAGVQRIIYLGGLTSGTSAASQHLKSRQETGKALREFGPSLTEFRAGIIVGNGSVSFEMIRYLTERLPVMICPRWVVTRIQPIAINDVLEYLVLALDVPQSAGEIIEIGGATVETYRSMMLTYARIRGLRRWLIRVPILTPRLSSYWLNLVTPIPASIARPLIEGLRTEVVCTSSLAGDLFPGVRPISYSAAVKVALQRPVPNPSFQRPSPGTTRTYVRREGLICDSRQATVRAPAEKVFAGLQTLGGREGWPYANLLWQLRGLMDRAVGGVGMNRSRKHGGPLRTGDHLDFWLVERAIRPQELLLRAEMKLPGRAWLQFVVSSSGQDESKLLCSAWFEPRGIAGELYWSVLYPIHYLIFQGMVSALQRRAEGPSPLQTALSRS